MLIAILGFGRFGQALSDLLVQAGHDVRAYDPNVAVPPGLGAASTAEAIHDASGSFWRCRCRICAMRSRRCGRCCMPARP
jgi:6-phosphogluconate dehydrogenase (decarboxylating)